MQVIPAILPKSFDELKEKLQRLDGMSTLVQIDICDGVFGREKTWMPCAGDNIPVYDNVSYQYDVMVSDWRFVITNIVSLAPQPESIVIHVDSLSDDDLDEIILLVRPTGARIGVSAGNDIPLDLVFNAVRKVREVVPIVFVQVMGIKNVGEQGQDFDAESLSRIMAVSREFGGILIQVDGAMRPETAVRARDAGAEAIVVGSYILRHDDPGAAYGELSSL